MINRCIDRKRIASAKLRKGPTYNLPLSVVQKFSIDFLVSKELDRHCTHRSIAAANQVVRQ